MSVLVQLTAERTGLHPVARTCFAPPPNVDSALVAFRRTRDWGPELAGVRRVVQGAFAHRRKTLAELARALRSCRPRADGRGAGRARTPGRRRAPRSSRRPSSSDSPSGSHETRAGRSRRRRSTSRSSSESRGPTGCTRSPRSSSASTSATASSSSRRASSRSRASETTRSSGGRSSSSRARPRWSRPGGRGITKEIPVAAGPRRRERRRGRCSPPRQRRTRTAARRRASPGSGGRARRGRPVLPRARAEAGGGSGRTAEADRAPAGLLGAARASPRRGEGFDRRDLRAFRRAGRRGRVCRAEGGAPRCARRRCVVRATSPRCRPTISPRPPAARPLTEELRSAGALRADLSGAGPAVYGLFHRREDARAAARKIGRRARTWVVAPVW